MEKYFVRIIDENGFFVCDDFVDELTELTIETPCQEGLYLPKWDGSAWVEGKTTDEIAAIKASMTTEKDDSERISDLETLVLELGGIL
jgi:hypothetical protein